mgnify:CR=1 FL=1
MGTRLGRSSSLAFVALVMCASCSLRTGNGTSATTVPTSFPTTLPQTTTTLPSLLPSSGTIPGNALADVVLGSDLVATAARAIDAWKAITVECYPSKAEALAARDQFTRVASYLAKARSAARALADADVFKSLIATEDAYREFAATKTFVACNTAGDKTRSSTTLAGGSTDGLAAGGVVEVNLTVSGTPVVDREFTVADVGTPCDGLGANTTFLVNSRDATGRWIITDVVVKAEGETAAVITPTRSGMGAIEYLAYCGTSDKRHGVVTFNVKPTGDTTTTTPSRPAQTGPLVVMELSSDGRRIVIDDDATEVAVEPESVTAYLTANESDGGVLLARLNEGDWVALRADRVSWVAVGDGKAGLDLQIVGARTPVTESIEVTSPTTTTTTAPTTTVAASTSVPRTVNETGTGNDNTSLWVVLTLVGLAAAAVVLTRTRQPG